VSFEESLMQKFVTSSSVFPACLPAFNETSTHL